MLIIKKLLPQGAGLAPVLLKRAGVLALPFADRQHHEANLSDGDGTEHGRRQCQHSRSRPQAYECEGCVSRAERDEVVEPCEDGLVPARTADTGPS